MTAAGESSKKVIDLLRCPLCLKTYEEPKLLRCSHTFCLECLTQHSTGKGNEAACPLCQTNFTIPPNGIEALPTNDFIRQVVRGKRGPRDAEENDYNYTCELCSDSEAEVEATFYCVECDQRICDRCSVTHRKSNASRTHQVLRETDVTQEDRRYLWPNARKRGKRDLNFCDQHSAEKNRLYCNDCNTVACHVCLVQKHNRHDMSDVNEAAEKFRKRIRRDASNVTIHRVVEKAKNIKRLETEANVCLRKIEAAESEILQRCDLLTALLQSQKSQLMTELKNFKDKILKEVDAERVEILRQSTIRDRFKRRSLEMVNKGTACDISHAAHDLHARAMELLKTRDEADCRKRSEVEFTFKLSLTAEDSAKNLIGEIVISDSATAKDDILSCIDGRYVLSAHTSFLCIPGLPRNQTLRITGTAILDGELFVVFGGRHVFAFKCDETFALNRTIGIIGSTNTAKLEGLVACSRNNCLYVVDPDQRVIYRYDLRTHIVIKWSVGGTCHRLALTKSYNVLATLFDKNRIQEYTTRGELIREIRLDSGVEHPWHSVQLSTGNYAVCYRGSQHGVCIVDQSGYIVESYGGPPGGDEGQLNYPAHLAVDANDNVLVADCYNNKVQLLSPTLTHLCDIEISGHEMKAPIALNFDELNRRFYISELFGGRVLVIVAAPHDIDAPSSDNI